MNVHRNDQPERSLFRGNGFGLPVPRIIPAWAFGVWVLNRFGYSSKSAMDADNRIEVEGCAWVLLVRLPSMVEGTQLGWFNIGATGSNEAHVCSMLRCLIGGRGFDEAVLGRAVTEAVG